MSSPMISPRICSPMYNRAAICVLGPRSGMKDEHNSLNVERQPGPLVAPLGGRVEQYYALDGIVPVGGTLGSGTASLWAEQLSVSAPDVDVLLRYGKSNGWLDDQPAMISRPVGRGRISYLGAVLDPNLMQQRHLVGCYRCRGANGVRRCFEQH